MKQKQWITLLGMVAVALILAACDGDSGNNSSESEGDSSSSVVKSSSSSAGVSGSSVVASSSSAKLQSSSSVPLSSSTANSSSSSVVASSSGAKVQSSSSVTVGVVDPSTVVSGTMTDSRDGRTYRTVKIGTQTWMAENLNYADSIAMPNLAGNSWCYGNSADSCAKYGRLYTWTGVMNIASSYQSARASSVISSPHQGVCPTGWHVPSGSEWVTLETAVGASTAGTALKSASGWYNDGNGTDRYGFSALPGGYYYGSGFYSVGYYGNWWTATEYGLANAYYWYMDNFYTHVYTNDIDKMHGRSLRCLKD